GKIDWEFIDGGIAPLYSDGGRPGIATQFVIGLFFAQAYLRTVRRSVCELLRVAHESGALRTKDLARVTVDTTVQPNDITFPTDAKLLHAAIKGLTRLARTRCVRLRQSYAQSSSQHNWSAAAERIWSFQSSDRKMIADHRSSTSLT